MKAVPFDEIVANPSDLKHVAELLRCSDGLGVAITVGLHHLCVFQMRFPNEAKWFRTEVGRIDTQIAHFAPLSVARISGGLLPRLCSFMLIISNSAV